MGCATNLPPIAYWDLYRLALVVEACGTSTTAKLQFWHSELGPIRTSVRGQFALEVRTPNSDALVLGAARCCSVGPRPLNHDSFFMAGTLKWGTSDQSPIALGNFDRLPLLVDACRTQTASVRTFRAESEFGACGAFARSLLTL